jgi:putative membrane protein
MSTLALALVALMALLHVYILVLEMFLWTTPRGRRAFGTTKEFAEASKTLAANQGLYNGFLAAGLAWGLLRGGTEGFQIDLFFLGCIFVAGVYGGLTASRKILFIQAVPAAITSLVLVYAWLSGVAIAGVPAGAH